MSKTALSGQFEIEVFAHQIIVTPLVADDFYKLAAACALKLASDDGKVESHATIESMTKKQVAA